jgi:Xaa-Pro aminopeptidase
MKKGPTAGFDPWLLTDAGARRYTKALEKAGAQFRPVARNLVDAIWTDRPAPPDAPIFAQPLAYAGMTAADKLETVREALREKEAQAALITLTDSVSWLFNIRGRDIIHTPVVLAFALVPLEGRAELFIAPEKVPAELRAELEPVARLRPPDELQVRLAGLGAQGAAVLLDPAHAAFKLAEDLREAGARIIAGADPCLMPKAVKTQAEQAGARAAHLRDGAAMARFLCWLEDNAAHGRVDEIGADVKLEQLRIETAERLGEPLSDLSFDTISAAGAHGAIVHYRVTEESNAPLKPGELYLVDSGGQYRDGTTDITRTVFIGPPDMEPDAEMKRHFTLVLKGHIALASARFPAGTTGGNLDALARQFLWAHGLDYDHGTGHGVGSFLSVHEGPQRISRTGTVALKPGMITSNEPGYYREGHYGIRIESLLLCKQAARREGDERALLSFETLTLCPIDRRLIDVSLLSMEERAWLDGYHAHVRAALSPMLENDAPTLAWLERACAPLG